MPALPWAAREPEEIPGYDPQRGMEPPSGPADVVLVGVGAVGALISPVLARAGLRVVGLEAGPYRTKRVFVPDELASSIMPGARGAGRGRPRPHRGRRRPDGRREHGLGRR